MAAVHCTPEDRTFADEPRREHAFLVWENYGIRVATAADGRARTSSKAQRATASYRGVLPGVRTRVFACKVCSDAVSEQNRRRGVELRP